MSFLANTHFFEVPVWEQIVRLLAAAILGSILGMERELKNKPAGFITFMFVSVGACMFALLQINILNMVNVYNQGVEEKLLMESDAGRIIAQVVSGIGFLGAGTIIFNKGSVKGITTAAMLWMSASLGLLVGMGGKNNYFVAGVTAIILIPLMLTSRRLGRRIIDPFRVHRIFISFQEPREKELYDFLINQGASIKKTFFHNKFQHNGMDYKEVYFYFSVTKNTSFDEIVRAVSHLEWVQSIEDL